MEVHYPINAIGVNTMDNSTKIRVAWLIRGLGAGGAEHLLLQHAESMQSELDIHVAYTMSDRTHLHQRVVDTGASVTLLSKDASRRMQKLGFSWVIALRHWLREVQPDVIHCHSPVVAVACRLLSRLKLIPAAPIVYTEHSMWTNHRWITRLANRLTFGWQAKVVSVSAVVKASMGACGEAAEVLIHGVDSEAVTRAALFRDTVRAEWGVPEDAVVLGMMANLRPEKNHAMVFPVLHRLVNELPNLVVVVHGQGVLEKELRSQLATLGHHDRFLLLGYTDAPHKALAAYDIVLLASQREGLPVVLMEAINLQLPIIASSVGGIPDMFSEGEAVLIGEASEQSVEKGVRWLLDQDQGAARRQAIKEKLAVKPERFDNVTYKNRIITIYRGLLHHRH